MKTLDEVIEAIGRCWSDNCFDCPYHEKKHVESCTRKRDTDALIYLRAYQWQMTNPDGDHLQLEKCRALLQDFYCNEPLSWDELRTMEGKPVWVERCDGDTKGWLLILRTNYDVITCTTKHGNSFYLYKNHYCEKWQAYRKERNVD